MAEQFDMFSEQAPRDHVVARGSSKSARPDKQAISMSEEDMVRHLSESGRYRILQKLTPRVVVPFPRPEYPLKGITLDTETTGLNARKDEIIEIGVIAFTFDATRSIGDVTGIYGGLRQPSVSIPSDITVQRHRHPLRQRPPELSRRRQIGSGKNLDQIVMSLRPRQH
ncbi:hypothetical protein GFM07_38255 [Rhizobium leguminosarum bv. viciae]|nr:hypothetical protein [Rhizobium leguminosarum bv. viciae]